MPVSVPTLAVRVSYGNADVLSSGAGTPTCMEIETVRAAARCGHKALWPLVNRLWDAPRVVG
jgi:hypothetical protein